MRCRLCSTRRTALPALRLGAALRRLLRCRSRDTRRHKWTCGAVPERPRLTTLSPAQTVSEDRVATYVHHRHRPDHGVHYSRWRCAMTGADRIIRSTTAGAVVGVGAVAAVASYEHAYALVLARGEAGWTARLVPLTADGPVCACSMVVLDSARRKMPLPALARRLLGVGIAAVRTWPPSPGDNAGGPGQFSTRRRQFPCGVAVSCRPHHQADRDETAQHREVLEFAAAGGVCAPGR